MQRSMLTGIFVDFRRGDFKTSFQVKSLRYDSVYEIGVHTWLCTHVRTHTCMLTLPSAAAPSFLPLACLTQSVRSTLSEEHIFHSMRMHIAQYLASASRKHAFRSLLLLSGSCLVDSDLLSITEAKANHIADKIRQNYLWRYTRIDMLRCVTAILNKIK